MDRRQLQAFTLLVTAQAAHSVEEYVFRLYDRLPPARFLSDLTGVPRPLGFVTINAALVLFGLWCCLVAARSGGASARALAWGWAIVELANGCGHLAFAAAVGGYYPGLFTAPLLIAAALLLIARLRVQPAGMSSTTSSFDSK